MKAPLILFFLLMLQNCLCWSQERYIIRSDSSFPRHIRAVRSGEGLLDFEEPVNQHYLWSDDQDTTPPKVIRVSNDHLFRIGFDNDILDYTDRFYTNGIALGLIGPYFQGNILNRLLVPYWGEGKNYYGIELIQNMYTPSTTKVGGIHFGDRPYAAYLVTGIFKISTDPVHHFRQYNSIHVGVIGPLSFGEWVQTAFHSSVPTNDKPLGWEYQVANDFILNWDLLFEKGIYQQKHLEINLVSCGSLGTLYTHVSGGIKLRTGWFNPYFLDLGVARRNRAAYAGLRNFQFAFYITGTEKLIGYDATLQGGLMNNNSVYVIPSGDINRLVSQATAGITVAWRGIKLDIEQFILSPEFSNGFWHKWVHIGLTFAL